MRKVQKELLRIDKRRSITARDGEVHRLITKASSDLSE